MSQNVSTGTTGKLYAVIAGICDYANEVLLAGNTVRFLHDLIFDRVMEKQVPFIFPKPRYQE